MRNQSDKRGSLGNYHKTSLPAVTGGHSFFRCWVATSIVRFLTLFLFIVFVHDIFVFHIRNKCQSAAAVLEAETGAKPAPANEFD